MSPYVIKQISKNRFSVINSDTGKIHAKSTSLHNAESQVRIMEQSEGKGIIRDILGLKRENNKDSLKGIQIKILEQDL